MVASRARREDAKGKSRDAHDAADERRDGARSKTATAEREGKGRGEEMRSRRDERKALMEESKSAREPATPEKGKKPWWKFWGDETPSGEGPATAEVEEGERENPESDDR